MNRLCNICDTPVFTHRRSTSDGILQIKRHEKDPDSPNTGHICTLCIYDTFPGKPTQEKINRAMRILLTSNGMIVKSLPLMPKMQEGFMGNFYEYDRLTEIEDAMCAIEEKIEDDMARFALQLEKLWDAIDRLQTLIDERDNGK